MPRGKFFLSIDRRPLRAADGASSLSAPVESRASLGWTRFARPFDSVAEVESRAGRSSSSTTAPPTTRTAPSPRGRPPPLDARGPPGVQLKMIDFAHVRKDDTPDAGYILGLTRVIRLFDVLLGHGPAPPDA